MSLNRYARKRDIAEKGILDALERAGFRVWNSLPVDLLTWRADLGFQLLECKSLTATGKIRKRKDQKTQQEFINLTGCAVAGTGADALVKLRAAS